MSEQTEWTLRERALIYMYAMATHEGLLSVEEIELQNDHDSETIGYWTTNATLTTYGQVTIESKQWIIAIRKAGMQFQHNPAAIQVAEYVRGIQSGWGIGCAIAMNARQLQDVAERSAKPHALAQLQLACQPQRWNTAQEPWIEDALIWAFNKRNGWQIAGGNYISWPLVDYPSHPRYSIDYQDGLFCVWDDKQTKAARNKSYTDLAQTWKLYEKLTKKY